MKKIFSILFLGLSIAQTAISAEIRGKLTDRETKEPLMGANVVLLGTSYGAAADLDGQFEIKGIKPGSYNIKVSILGYQEKIIYNQVVTEGIGLNLNIELESQTMKLAEVEVSYAGAQGTQERELKERMRATEITDALSSEALKSMPDPDIASVVRRAAGVSTMGGDPIIRGLGVRYSKVTLNNAQLSGTEPNRSAVSLELFPASMMQQVTVNKSYLPDQFGEFGGGVLDMNSWKFSGQNDFSISASSSFNSQLISKDIMYYKAGNFDFLGFDTGNRALPEPIANTQGLNGLPSHETEYLGEAFQNNWNYYTMGAVPNQSYSVTYSSNKTLFGRPFGFITSGLYRNGYSYMDYKQNAYSGAYGGLNTIFDYRVKETDHDIAVGGMGSCRFDLNPMCILTFTTLYTRNTNDEVRDSEGWKEDFDGNERRYRFRYVGETIWTNQLGGEYVLPKVLNSNLSWKLTYTRGMRYEPFTRQVGYQEMSDGLWQMIIQGFSINPGLSLSNLYSELYDDTYHTGFDWTMRPIADNAGFKVKTGFDIVNRHRDVESRLIRFLARPDFPAELLNELDPEDLLVPENIQPGVIEINELTSETDDYEAFQDLWGTYIMAQYPLTEKLNVSGGFRLESSMQKVSSFAVDDPEGTKVDGKIETTDVLPALNFIYDYDKMNKFRFALSQTVARPDFRELSLYRFQDFDGGYSVIGYPDLKRTVIRNADLRYERLIGKSNLFSASAFYKYFDSPIEVVRISGSAKDISYRNAESAFNYGVEFELRQYLGVFSSYLKQFSVSTNLTLLQSEVKIATETAGEAVVTSGDRPLQGQSPYLFNFNLNYTHPNQLTQADLLFNVFGKRITEVGNDVLPNIYEYPHADLDLTFRHPLTGNLTLKGSVENILDPEYRFQHEGAGNYFTQLYNKGRSYSLGITYKP